MTLPSINMPWTNRVHSNPLRAQFACHASRHLQYGGFRTVVAHPVVVLSIEKAQLVFGSRFIFKAFFVRRLRLGWLGWLELTRGALDYRDSFVDARVSGE